MGRGPTTLISPVATLISCGSSSSESRRSTFPTGVMREASGKIGLSPATIVRNFQTRNGRPSMPTRSCRKNTPPGEVSPTAAAQSTPIAAAGTATSASSSRSNRRLPRYGPFRTVLLVLASTGDIVRAGSRIPASLRSG